MGRLKSDSITINLTGKMKPKSRDFDVKNYIVNNDNNFYTISYSLHSNFEEIAEFVKSIKPCILNKVTKNKV
jgi:hypothetical protein